MMTTIDITAIVLSMIGMASGWLTWFLDRRKHRQEVELLKAEAKKKYMDLATMYVDEYTKNIVKPLEGRVNELTNEVKHLKDELETVKKCACYRPNCAKRLRLLDKPDDDVRGEK